VTEIQPDFAAIEAFPEISRCNSLLFRCLRKRSISAAIFFGLISGPLPPVR